MNFTLVNKISLFLAKRNSGKTCLLKYLVNEEKDKFHKIFVISPTEEINHYYTKNKITEPQYVYNHYNERFIERLMDKMRKENENKSPEEMTKVLLVLDDCLGSVNFHNNDSLKKLYATSRHFGISLAVVLQYLHAITPLERNNTDFILCSTMNNNSLEILMDEFLSGDITRPQFKQFFRQATKDYGFCILNNNATKTNDLDSMYGCVRVPKECI